MYTRHGKKSDLCNVNVRNWGKGKKRGENRHQNCMSSGVQKSCHDEKSTLSLSFIIDTTLAIETSFYSLSHKAHNNSPLNKLVNLGVSINLFFVTE